MNCLEKSKFLVFTLDTAGVKNKSEDRREQGPQTYSHFKQKVS